MKPDRSNSPLLNGVGGLHGRFVHKRRTRRLAAAVSNALPSDPEPESALDIGCGDGTIAALLHELRPGVSIHGAETQPRPTCAIECTAFDGLRTPFDDAAFDACLLIDVIHHSGDAAALLREAARCARRCVIVKDHVCSGRVDRLTLRFMDWVGNRPQEVALPYNYLPAAGWTDLFTAAGLKPTYRQTRLGLYPFPCNLVFGRKLHFIARLEAT